MYPMDKYFVKIILNVIVEFSIQRCNVRVAIAIFNIASNIWINKRR